MARRKNQKPHLLTEATVKKFMKLANLNDLSSDFRSNMGYRDESPEKNWEQPGLSRYKSRNHLLREQDEELPPEEGGLEAGGEMPMDAEPEAAPAPAGDAAAQVEDIVSAIADAIEEVVPEVSVDVAAGDDAAPAPEAEAAPMDDAPAPAAEEPPMGDDEAALRETIGRAIREALLQQEQLTDGAGNDASAPSAAAPDGKKDPAIEKGSMPDALSEQNGEGDSAEVEAVVDAIVDALEATTDMEVEAEPAEGEANGAAEEPAAEEAPPADDEEAAMKKMYEALRNRKTAKRLIERVVKRAQREAGRSPQKRVVKESTRRRMRRAVRNGLKK